jgi:two-component system, NarL family, sensor histidine kinase UhpB
MTVTDRRRELAEDYVLALQHYLAEPEEPALARAYELGRRALTDGLGVLAMAAAHSRALAVMLNGPLADNKREQLLNGLEAFLVEALSPFEMANRGFWEAHLAMRRLNDVLEGQSKRIASALHDEAGQLLACVHLALAAAASKLPADGAREIQDARGLLNQTEQRLRNLAHELRPPILDDLGLVAALEFLTDGVSKRWGLAVSMQVSITRALPPTLETTFYRITQEALNNIVKHAQASHASVIMQQSEDQISCSIRDDGIGCDAEVIAAGKHARGLGLREIQERVTALGGNFRMSANAPRGTALTVEIPLAR